MAKTQEPEDDKQVVLTISELKSLLNTSKESNNDQLAKALEAMALALGDMKKPYVDPKQQENDELFRHGIRESRAKIEADIKASQDYCQHLQGSNALSSETKEKSSFAIHVLDTGEMIGVCTNCQKLITTLNRAHGQLFAKARGAVVSRSGQRFFVDPIKAQLARLGTEDRKRFLNDKVDGASI